MKGNCTQYGIPCHGSEYAHFDKTAKLELVSPPTVHEMVNESDYCQVIFPDALEGADGIWISPLNDYLVNLHAELPHLCT